MVSSQVIVFDVFFQGNSSNDFLISPGYIVLEYFLTVCTESLVFPWLALMWFTSICHHEKLSDWCLRSVQDITWLLFELVY